MPARLVRKKCTLDASRRGRSTWPSAVWASPRAHDRILKGARTFADIGGSPTVAAKQVADAVQCRSLDRDYWT